MANTTNFGWETPDDTDLVKDGAAAIRTLGSAIDTSLVDLKGGTTGQILSKTSNTDMDFTWITNDQGDITAVTAGTGISGGGTTGAVTITNSMATAIDAKGDLIAGTGADAFDRLAVGSNGTVLTADSTTATGLKWASASAVKSYSLLNSGGTALSGALTVTVSGLSGYDNLVVVITGASTGSSSTLRVRFNSDSGTNYVVAGPNAVYASTYASGNFSRFSSITATEIEIGQLSTNANSTLAGALLMFGSNSTGSKAYLGSWASSASTGNNNTANTVGGMYLGTSVIDSVSVISGAGNFNGGNVYIYGAV